MKNYYFLWAFLTSVVNYCSSQKMSSATADTDQEQEIIKLSKEKWQWMADQNVEILPRLVAYIFTANHLDSCNPYSSSIFNSQCSPECEIASGLPEVDIIAVLHLLS